MEVKLGGLDAVQSGGGEAMWMESLSVLRL